MAPRGKSAGSQTPVLPCAKEYIDGYNNYLENRGDHIHAGEDFPTPCGSELYACEDGVAKTVFSNSDGYYGYIDLNVGKYVLRYAHVQDGKDGSFKRGEVIGHSGDGQGNYPCHLHFEVRTDGGGFGDAGTIAPEDYLTGAVSPGGGGDVPQGSGSNDLGSFSEEDLFAIARASAVSTMFELPGLLNAAESLYMTGAKSIYNDEPLMPFVQQLCKASMRQFQSLPNGAFFAFFADQFGLYGHRKPYWNVDNIEIVEGGVDLNDETLATHVFVVGDTGPSFVGDGAASLPEKVNSKGVVTIYDAFMSEHMIARGAELDKDDPEEKKLKKLAGYSEAQQFLRKYGVRPHYEEATFIRNSFFEIFYAYTQFQTLWASQYRTQFTFTFMPELYPGGVVAFEEHGIRCYIDEVTHNFDHESGFTTMANLSAPAALNNSDSPVAAGMVLPFFGTKRKDDRPKLPPPDHPKVEHPNG